MHHTADERLWIRNRSLAIAEMLKMMGGIYQPPETNQDLSSHRRHMWERILGLPDGALSWHRFAGQFAGWSTNRIASHWFSEQALGYLVTCSVELVSSAEEPIVSSSELILKSLEFIEVDPGQTMWLTGSADVARELHALDVYAPSVRRKPQAIPWERYEVVVICRGPAMHKHFNMWLAPIGRLRVQPAQITTASSNISGIAADFYGKRDNIRQILRLKRSA